MTIMKNSILSIAATLTLILGFGTSLSAQTIITWKGGAPGQEQNWNCPKNWSSYRVPDSFTDVVIPDVSTTSLAAPIISTGVFEVNSILLQSNANMTIEKGAQLVVYNAENCFFNEQSLHLKGSLLILDEPTEASVKKGVALEANRQ